MKYIFLLFAICFFSCSKNNNNPSPPSDFNYDSSTINGINKGTAYYNVNYQPSIKLYFSTSIEQSSANDNILLTAKNGSAVNCNFSFENNESTVIIQPSSPLSALNQYNLNISKTLKSVSGAGLQNNITIKIITSIDSTDKFPRISDSALLNLVQQQTFKYFWDLGHPVSGLARERSSSGDVCTTGGTGFGVMSMLAAINRNFISRTDGLVRIQKIVSFLKSNCTTYHGAFSHWIDGATGATVPFSTQDDGADLVETSYLMEGLLCARQFFNTSDAAEINLRNDINTLWNAVEWNWFRQNNQNVLYWHWSPNYGWAINAQISGWNEALITYALAASSLNYSIPKIVYDNGWAQNGNIKNGNSYYGIKLPLGPNLGGPLFFAHYSFLGINPNQLTDNYADYWTQDTAHAKINYSYCVANPHVYNSYSNQCWGLTASDDNYNYYDAHAPDNDDGVITPTAAVSSLPYSPSESMNAIRFFYYTLGDKLWSTYGFRDAFNLTDIWFDGDFLAIDQGPEIVMIENSRSGLLWNLFMSCPEIKTGMKGLGFQSPYLN